MVKKNNAGGLHKATIEEFKNLYAASGKKRYNLDDMWPEDLTEALAAGDIPELEEARKKGWDVNMPLKSIYTASLERQLEDAAKLYDGKKFKPLPGLEYCYSESAARKEMKDFYVERVHARIVFPITWSIQKNSLESVKWLMKHGAVLDITKYPSGEYIDGDNRHALLLAQTVSKEMLSLVLEGGAKVKGKDFDFFLFNLSNVDELKEQIPILLEHGADIEAAIKAVKNAVSNGDLDKVGYFLDIGFDINCQTKKGRNFLKDTVLGHAALYGTPKTVRYLLSRGADPTIRNAKGMTPYDLALQNHKLENAAILRDLCDPDGEGRRQAKEKLPQDIRDYLKDGGRRLTLGRDDIDYIDFLALDDVTLLSLARRKCVLLSKEVENYSTLWIVWNTTRKTVAYYDYENEWYGEFKVSFSGFLAGIDQYLTGIFHGDYEQ